MLWHIQIEPAPGQPDRIGERLALEAVESGLVGPWSIRASRGFLIEGAITEAELERAARGVLVDPVVETHTVRSCRARWEGAGRVVYVMPRPGVTDPEAESALELLHSLDYAVSHVRTIRTYRIEGPDQGVPRLIARVLANDAVELAVEGTLPFAQLGQGRPYRFERIEVPLGGRSDQELLDLSRKGQLALSLAEMKTIQRHFAELGRDPTDCELEALAQTWSEHCSHKTLRGGSHF